jgi:hypothetical protein
VGCAAGPSAAAQAPPAGQGDLPGTTTVGEQAISFSGAPSKQFIKPGETLLYRDVQLDQLADTFSYSFSPSQPYINQAVGYLLWPSIALAPNVTVSDCCISSYVPRRHKHCGHDIMGYLCTPQHQQCMMCAHDLSKVVRPAAMQQPVSGWGACNLLAVQEELIST